MEKKNLVSGFFIAVLAGLVTILAFSTSQLDKQVKTQESTISAMQETIQKMQEDHTTLSESTVASDWKLFNNMNSFKNQLDDINAHLKALDGMVIDNIAGEYQEPASSGQAFDDEYLYDVPGYTVYECCGNDPKHVLAQYSMEEIAYALNTEGVFEAYCQKHNFTVKFLPYYCG